MDRFRSLYNFRYSDIICHAASCLLKRRKKTFETPFSVAQREVPIFGGVPVIQATSNETVFIISPEIKTTYHVPE